MLKTVRIIMITLPSIFTVINLRTNNLFKEKQNSFSEMAPPILFILTI